MARRGRVDTLDHVDITSWISLVTGCTVGATVALLVVRRSRPDPAAAVVPHRARVLLSSLPFPVVIARADGSVAFANSRASEWGLASSTRTLPDAARDLVVRAITSGAMVDDELRLSLGLAKAPVQFFAMAQPIPGEDLAFITIHDVDSAMAAEVARREFVVNVSHELKTPIGAIRLMGDAVSEAADDPREVKNFASRIIAEADRLAALVQQIIQLSRLQGAETVFDSRPVDFAGIVTAALASVSTLAESRSVTVRREGPASVMVAGDAELLGMAVRNLVENAIVFSPSGAAVTVTLNVGPEVATLAVIDRGLGIPLHEQSRVFERFYRADTARGRESGGSGLGLSIVKHVARQHGGAVKVWSQPDVGSTFSLTLPVIAEGGA